MCVCVGGVVAFLSAVNERQPGGLSPTGMFLSWLDSGVMHRNPSRERKSTATRATNHPPGLGGGGGGEGWTGTRQQVGYHRRRHRSTLLWILCVTCGNKDGDALEKDKHSCKRFVLSSINPVDVSTVKNYIPPRTVVSYPGRRQKNF